MQTELLNRKRWDTRVELASAMFEYVGVFHNRQRRQSSIGMFTPQPDPIPPNPGHINACVKPGELHGMGCEPYCAEVTALKLPSSAWN